MKGMTQSALTGLIMLMTCCDSLAYLDAVTVVEQGARFRRDKKTIVCVRMNEENI